MGLCLGGERGCAERGWGSIEERDKRFRLCDETKPERFGTIQLLATLSLGKAAMMQMGFVERFPPDFSGLQKRQRLALGPRKNLEGPNGTDANATANIGKQRQYQGSDTDTKQALIPGSPHRLHWDFLFNHLANVA